MTIVLTVAILDLIFYTNTFNERASDYDFANRIFWMQALNIVIMITNLRKSIAFNGPLNLLMFCSDGGQIYNIFILSHIVE